MVQLHCITFYHFHQGSLLITFISQLWINIQRLIAQIWEGSCNYFFSPTLNPTGHRRFCVYFFCRSTGSCNLSLQSQSPLGQYLLLLVPKTFSAHDPIKFDVPTLSISLRVCIICSLYPLVWGCEVVLNSNLVPNPVCNSFQNIEMNLTSRSDTIETGTPCNRTISFKYDLASFLTGSVVFIGKKWVYLDIWSTITQYNRNLSSTSITPT